MQAIVLAGGFGTRLRSVVAELPKAMAPLAGRPFLAYLLDHLADEGFSSAVLAVGYRHEAISSHFGASYRRLSLLYSVETEPLGTGGAIRLACGQVQADDVFVLNGDTYLGLDCRAMMAAHTGANAWLTMAVSKVSDVRRFGALDIRGGIVRGFREKGASGSGWINAGTYILNRGLRERLLPSGAFSFEQEVLVPHVEALQPLAFEASGPFIDIGIPADYARAADVLLRTRTAGFAADSGPLG